MHRHEEIVCDLAVVGAGPGGLSAALAAARLGKQVVLVERSSALGGAASSGLGFLGYYDRRGHRAIGGLAQEYVDRLLHVDGSIGHFLCPAHNCITPILPDFFKIIAVEMCQEAHVQVLFNFDLLDVQVEGPAIEHITVYGKGTEIKIKARMYIDGTGDGDLAYMAGVPFTAGQDGTGINQPATLMFSVSNIDILKLYEYFALNPHELGIKEKYADGYDLSFFMKTPGHCLVGLNGLIEKARQAGDFDIPRNQFTYISYPDVNQIAVNTVRIINIDGSDPIQLSAGLEEGYRQIGILIKFMRQYVPGFAKATITQISPSLGIRESRHFEGIRRLTRDDVFNYRIDSETVALCAYNVDIHSGDGSHVDLMPVEKPFGIPLGCMIPKTIDNLLFTGRTISVDSVAYGAVRIMSTAFALGEAAGTAAALGISDQVKPAALDVAAVRTILLKNGAILTTDPD
jgi:hypothetical protein